jgi:hypothetical protein
MRTRRLLLPLVVVAVLLFLALTIYAQGPGNTGTSGNSGNLGSTAIPPTATPTATPVMVPTVVVLQPDSTTGYDTWIRQDYDINYGVSTLLNAGAAVVAKPRRGLLKFDLSSIPAGSTVQTATLTLYNQEQDDSTAYNVDVHRSLTQWYAGIQNGDAPTEDGSTWGYRNYNGSVAWGAAGGLAGTDYVQTATASVAITGYNAPFNWDVTADVSAWVAGTATNRGWWLINASENTDASRKGFTSSDGATPANRPLLTVWCTEPVTGGSGLSTPAYFVADTGNNAAAGTQVAPWRTVAYGLAHIAAGDTLYIRGGTYQEKVTMAASGLVTAPITITAYPGETAILDGNNWTLAAENNHWGIGLDVTGSYININDLEVRYFGGIGVEVTGSYVTMTNIYAHHNWQEGIIYYTPAQYGVVQDSRVWVNCLGNQYGTMFTGWAAALAAMPEGTTGNHVFRRNHVWENWGEGVDVAAAYCTVEDNIIHDNWATQLYLTGVNNALVQRNFMYSDPTNPTIFPYTHPLTSGHPCGIEIGDERSYWVHDVQIINNVVYGSNHSLYWWDAGGHGMTNTIIAYNSFISATGTTANIEIDPGLHANVVVENNLVQQDDALEVAAFAADADVIWRNNNWSKTAPVTVRDATDVVAPPLLFDIVAHPFITASYKLTASSPGISHAVAITQTTTDFFNVARNATTPSMGAAEYVP